jgi:hypothetical protein
MTWFGERPKRRFIAYLGLDQIKDLKKISIARDTPIAVLIRNALDEYIDAWKMATRKAEAAKAAAAQAPPEAKQ